MKHLISIILILVSITCLAKEFTSEKQDSKLDLNNFVTYYYQRPQPEKLSLAFKQMLKDYVRDSKENTWQTMSYFFGKTALGHDDIIDIYMASLKDSNHMQKEFIIYTLAYCANDDVIKLFKEKLEDAQFEKEKPILKDLLKRQLPLNVNLLATPITSPDQLDYLWTDFMISGSNKPIEKIIDAISLRETGKGFGERIVGGAAIWSLGSNCKTHSKVLDICKEQWKKQQWPIKQELREMINKADDSFFDKYFQNQKLKKIVVRDTNPKIEKDSFASKPRTIYRLGSQYARIEEALDKKMNLHGLIIVNQPDAWMIDLLTESGNHHIDPDENGKIYFPILSVDDKTEIAKLEFGHEIDFMQKHKATISTDKTNDNGLTLYETTVDGYEIQLFTSNKIPVRLKFLESNKIIGDFVYDEYKTDIKINLSLFDIPKDVKIKEPTEQ